MKKLIITLYLILLGVLTQAQISGFFAQGPVASDPYAAYSTELQAWVAEVIATGCTVPDFTDLDAIDVLISALISNSYWDHIDCMYLHAVGSGEECTTYVNLRTPGTYTLTKTGTLTWDALNGVTTSTTTANYYNTGYRINITGYLGLSHYGNSFIGLFVGGTAINDRIYYAGGIGALRDFYIGERRIASARNIYAAVNSTSLGTTTHSNTAVYSPHLVSAQSYNTSNSHIQINGVYQASSTVFPSGDCDVDLYIGSVNGGSSSAHDNEIYATILGEAIGGADLSPLYDALNTYLTSIGSY